MKVKTIIIMVLLMLSVFSVLAACTISNRKIPDAETLAREIIEVYGYEPDEVDEKVPELLAKMKKSDETQWKTWTTLTKLWDYTRDEMTVNVDSLPDGLPEDDSLCIVILGFELNADGSMQDELIGRLQVALNCAEQYPNAYVLCTGGGTAADNPNVTEAGLMGEWLLANGLSEERLFAEEASLTTAQNAEYSYKLLKEKAPSVSSLAIVSSSYHIGWGTLLFQTELELLGVSDSLSVISNAAYETVNEKYADTYRFEAGGMMSVVLGDDETAMEIYGDTYQPKYIDKR